MRYWHSIIAAVAVLCCPRASSASTILDYTSDPNGLSFTVGISGVGQSFIAQEILLQDASLVLTRSIDSRVWWNDAHVVVFHGLPQPNDSGDSTDNAIFTSPRIDFSTLPVVGSAIGFPLYELQLTQHGLAQQLPLVPGDIYSLTLANFGTSGEAFFVENQPSRYGGGAFVSRSYDSPAW